MSDVIVPYRVIGREPSAYVSTFFNEIFICRMPDGSVKKILMKRGSIPAQPSREPRGGVPYEAEVYKKVLAPLAMSVPSLHAITSTSSETILWMDYVDGANRLCENASLPDAAAWIGEFHRRNEARTAELASLLPRYDLSYYVSWARRTADLAAPLKLAWLPAVCSAYEKIAEELANAVPTIIHGEFYPNNILVCQNRQVVPVDWESAAIAMGEIDLASLIAGWSEDDSLACQRAYQQARWQGSAQDGFARRLQLAKLYMCLRWLSDRSQWGPHPQELFAELRRLVDQLSCR
jgi:thiamine kinase-like enzyme